MISKANKTETSANRTWHEGEKAECLFHARTGSTDEVVYAMCRLLVFVNNSPQIFTLWALDSITHGLEELI